MAICNQRASKNNDNIQGKSKIFLSKNIFFYQHLTKHIFSMQSKLQHYHVIVI